MNASYKMIIVTRETKLGTLMLSTPSVFGFENMQVVTGRRQVRGR